ncbi:MAG TPA: hypothetical protein VG916_00695 [Gemmatimonadaceae bacterium]|nr:hypothetical protein [Gemmatimonadaceae bacterium]
MPTPRALSTGFSHGHRGEYRLPARADRPTLPRLRNPRRPMKFKPSIKRIKCGGLAAVELRTAALRLVVVTAKGPRIACFGRPGGDNLLLWGPGKYKRKSWELFGGHRLWITRPGADEPEETYSPDNRPCAVEVGKHSFTVTAPTDPVHLTQRGFTITALAPDRLQLDHFMVNQGNMLWSGGLWAVTSTVPIGGAQYTVPLGDGSRWDYATVVAVRTWGDDQGAQTFDDPRFAFTADSFRLDPVSGLENKRMIKADAGVMAMHVPAAGLLFAKHAPYQPDGSYPLGTNTALYVGPKSFMVEMETMGPVATVKPRHALRHVETWVLRDAKSAPSATALRKLFT